MKKLILLVLACLGISALSFAQGDQQAREAIQKFDWTTTELQFYNLMLPILITKDEYKQILPPIEKARERVRRTYQKWAKEIHELQPEIDDALAASKDKDRVLPATLQAKIDHERGIMAADRLVMAQVNEDDVYDAIVKALNPGQQKAMANSLNPKMIDPSLKPDKMTQEDKLRLFIRDVLLTPDFYDDLVKMSLKAG